MQLHVNLNDGVIITHIYCWSRDSLISTWLLDWWHSFLQWSLKRVPVPEATTADAPFFFVFPAPPTQTSQVRHCIRDAPLPAHNIGRLTYRLGSFYEPNMTFKLTTSCTRNQIQSPFIQIACHKEDNTDRKTASRGQRIFSIICAFKKKKNVPAEGRKDDNMVTQVNQKMCICLHVCHKQSGEKRGGKNVMKEVMWLIGGWEKH